MCMYVKAINLNTNVCDPRVFLIDDIPISPVLNHYEY
jgi:hypothetical protein